MAGLLRQPAASQRVQEALRHFKLIGMLIYGSQQRQKRRIRKCSFIRSRWHLLNIGHGLTVLSQFMLRADQARPCGNIAWIVAEDLRIQCRSLRKSFGLHQNACILQLGIRFKSGAVIGERQAKRLRQHPLCIRVTAQSVINGRQGAQILRIFRQRRLNRPWCASGKLKRFLIFVIASVCLEEPPQAWAEAGCTLINCS